MLCSICKSDEHLGKRCPYSWFAVSPGCASGDASPRVDADDDRQSVEDDQQSVDSLRWLMTMELSDDENEGENAEKENAENEKNDKIDENEKNDKIAENENNDENEEIIENDENEEIIENETNDVTDSIVDDHQPIEETVERSALDSQGLLQSPDPPDVTLAERPPLPATDSSEVYSPEVIILNSPPHPASDVPSSAAESTSDPVPPSSDPVPPSSDPVSESAQDSPPAFRLRGRRAPAPLPEALSGLQRRVTSPVLVTSRPRSAEGHNDEDSMDTTINLKTKSAPPKSAGKKGRKK